jgi:TPR repeat protein
MTWLKKSAEQGYAPAETILGYAYAMGEIVLKDMKKAKFWVEKGHEGGDTKAKEYWDKFELWKY